MEQFSNLSMLDVFGTTPILAISNIITYVFVFFSFIFLYHWFKFAVGNRAMTVAAILYFGISGLLFISMYISASHFSSV